MIRTGSAGIPAGEFLAVGFTLIELLVVGSIWNACCITLD